MQEVIEKDDKMKTDQRERVIIILNNILLNFLGYRTIQKLDK